MRTLLIDIETAPNVAAVFGVYKQNVNPKNITVTGYTLCWAAKWLGQRAIEFASVRADGEKGMMDRAWELLDQADAVIHYNGARFDIPTLQKEFLKLGMSPPSPYAQIDLLKTARTQFRLPAGNSLDMVLRELGVQRKMEHAGISMWLDCMNGCPKAWRRMELYNKRDVRVMEVVYRRFLPWIKSHPNMAMYSDGATQSCPHCGSIKLNRRGYQTSKSQKYRRFQCQDCGTWSRDRINSTPVNKKAVLVSV